jgi:hypothetical protein
LIVVTSTTINTPVSLLTIHCPPPNTFNFTNVPASSANISPATSIRNLT